MAASCVPIRLFISPCFSDKAEYKIAQAVNMIVPCRLTASGLSIDLFGRLLVLDAIPPAMKSRVKIAAIPKLYFVASIPSPVLMKGLANR